MKESEFAYSALIYAQGSEKTSGRVFRNVVCPLMSAFGWILSFALVYFLFIA